MRARRRHDRPEYHGRARFREAVFAVLQSSRLPSAFPQQQQRLERDRRDLADEHKAADLRFGDQERGAARPR